MTVFNSTDHRQKFLAAAIFTGFGAFMTVVGAFQSSPGTMTCQYNPSVKQHLCQWKSSRLIGPSETHKFQALKVTTKATPRSSNESQPNDRISTDPDEYYEIYFVSEAGKPHFIKRVETLRARDAVVRDAENFLQSQNGIFRSGIGFDRSRQWALFITVLGLTIASGYFTYHFRPGQND
jgi:hypothetical protein